MLYVVILNFHVHKELVHAICTHTNKKLKSMKSWSSMTEDL